MTSTLVTTSLPGLARPAQRAGDRERVARKGVDIVLGWALIAAGLGIALVALLGPLVTDVIAYRVSAGALNQVAGGDVAGLALVAPACLLAGGLALRGRRAGAVLALGPAGYIGYTVIQLAVGADVNRYPGNSERFFPLFLGLLILAIVIAVRAWNTIDAESLPATPRRVERSLGVFALLVATFLTLGLHLPGLLDAWSARPSSPEYLADPAVFWLVKLMDLGLVVPALLAVGWGTLRGSRGVQKVTYAAAGWMAMLGTAVAGMAVVMQATGDPAATTANTAAFSGFAIVGLLIAVLVHRPLFFSRVRALHAPDGAGQLNEHTTP